MCRTGVVSSACINSASFVTDNLFGDLAIGLDHNLIDLEGGLDWLGLVIHPLKLLEGSTLGFDTVKDGPLAHIMRVY